MSDLVNCTSFLCEVSEKGYIELFNAVVLFITLIALLVYTHQTIEIRKISEHQKDLQILPCLILNLGCNDEDDVTAMELKNIGYGPAIAIVFRDVIFEAEENKLHFSFALKENISSIREGESFDVAISVKKNGMPVTQEWKEFTHYFAPSSLGLYQENEVYPELDIPLQQNIEIEFTDIAGTRYVIPNKFDSNNVSIGNSPKRI